MNSGGASESFFAQFLFQIAEILNFLHLALPKVSVEERLNPNIQNNDYIFIYQRKLHINSC